MQKEAIELQENLKLLADVEITRGSFLEYPSLGSSVNARSTSIKMKGRNRNAPCSCGSGKKFKKCCGGSVQ
jgi:uncharacterized protein YecA (UPF0149 family)